MGTLKNQKPRNYNNVTKSDIIFYCEEIKYISKQSGFTINQIIEIIKIKEKNPFEIMSKALIRSLMSQIW